MRAMLVNGLKSLQIDAQCDIDSKTNPNKYEENWKRITTSIAFRNHRHQCASQPQTTTIIYEHINLNMAPLQLDMFNAASNRIKSTQKSTEC